MWASRRNEVRLPGAVLPEGVTVSADPASLNAAEAWLVAVPAQRLRACLATLVAVAPPESPLVICIKGIERESGLMLDAVARSLLPASPLAVLSGPTFGDGVTHGGWLMVCRQRSP